MGSAGFRLRVTFAKKGRCRFLSHLEVAHALERTCRRAGLPYAVTQGFSPRMRIAFGPALPVGTGGSRERFDVWLARHVSDAEALDSLVAAAPAEIVPVEARYVGAGEPSLTAGISMAEYVVAVEEVDARTLGEALGAMMRAGELTVEHKGRKKVFDLSSSLPKEPRVEVGEDGVAIVRMNVLIGPEGSLRPETFVSSALSSIDAPGAVAKVTRTEIHQLG